MGAGDRVKGDDWSSWSDPGRFDFLLDRLHFIREEAFAVAASIYGKLLFTWLPLKESRLQDARYRHGFSLCPSETSLALP